MTLNHTLRMIAPRTASARTAAALLLLGGVLSYGQATNVKVAVTATQAVISYTAPDQEACSIDIREGNSQAPLVHDVDPSLFPGSNLDSRAAGLTTGRSRVFVAGKRAAEPGLDGRWYSRALQVHTLHVLAISCGANTFTRQFSTANSPVGQSLNDPFPVDPNHPGQYAWPTFSWTNRNEWVVDPFTGFRVRQLDSPRDAIETQPGVFPTASNVGTGGVGWTNPGAITADDSAAAVYSGATQDWLFTELALTFQNSAIHDSSASSLNAIVPSFNAWCSGSTCATASSADRSIEFCLTVDGQNCASDKIQAVLAACSSNCTSSANRFVAIANPQPILAEWFTSGTFPVLDAQALSKRVGNVNRNGAAVSWVYGPRFNLAWTAGTPITINGTVYTIASVDNDSSLTLAGTPAGSDASAQYSVSSAGLLIRKATTSTHEISIQYISYNAEIGDAPVAESAGDEDSYANCSPAQVTGPNNESGWHCHVAGTLYWIGKDSGTVNRIGKNVPPYNPDPNGWYQHQCSGGAYWDWTDGNTLYCPTQSVNGHLYLLKLVYTGSNADIGDLQTTQGLVICGTSPCWTITNLTPASQALDTQFAAFHPEWARANFHTNTIALVGRMGSTNSLIFMVRRDANNDTLAFLFRFDLNSSRVAGAVTTWATWPNRWAAMHGPFNINDPAWVHVSTTTLRGPFTGNDVAGNGPYLSTITSGAVPATGSACPARPSDSPISASDWPTGNLCSTLTVDGEPGDPTPSYYSGGTISVTGTAVTGTNTYWTSFMDGTQMLIGGTFYKFTYVNFNQGTLDSSPGTLTDVPYTLYLETVNSPKLGNPLWAYLQDAAPRDVFCLVNDSSTPCGNRYNPPGPELVRLLIKNGNTWIVQRGFAGTNPPTTLSAVNAGALLITLATSCYFGADAPCDEARTDWNVSDAYGLNPTLTTIVKDPSEQGCCHATHQNGVNVSQGIQCPLRDGIQYGCYFARFNGYPAAFSDPGFFVTSNAPFHGIVGVGYPNSVDSHPSHTQFSASDVENGWVGDARPFIGDAFGNLSGTAASPATNIQGSLWKLTSSQLGRLRPRVLTTVATCGSTPLLDVSGPASTITGASTDAFKYCIATNAGECVSNSSAGDAYANCPQTRVPYCTFQGVGQSDPDTRDICIFDMGSYTMNAVQIGVRKADPNGVRGRRVTSGFSRYHWVNPYWNVKILPDARWMIVWSTFFQGVRNSALLVKLPPFPEPVNNYGDYFPVTTTVPPPSIPGVNNAVVQFGYGKNLFCTSRQEVCVQGSAATFAYQGENPSGVPCANGCTIQVPAIPQRVLYYQIVLRDSQNAVLKTLPMEIRAVQ